MSEMKPALPPASGHDPDSCCAAMQLLAAAVEPGPPPSALQEDCQQDNPLSNHVVRFALILPMAAASFSPAVRQLAQESVAAVAQVSRLPPLTLGLESLRCEAPSSLAFHAAGGWRAVATPSSHCHPTL